MGCCKNRPVLPSASIRRLQASLPRRHHAGHRARLRTRAAISFAALPDYELLELILARSLPRGDIKPIAKALLARFASLAGVFGAAPQELTTIKGVGPAVALDLKLVHEATLRMGRGEVKKRTVISSWSALLAYTRVAMAHEAREQFRVLYLDKKNQLIADEVMNQGTVDHAPVYPREVMRRAPGAGGQRGDPGAQPSLRRSSPVRGGCGHDPSGDRGRTAPEDHGA